MPVNLSPSFSTDLRNSLASIDGNARACDQGEKLKLVNDLMILHALAGGASPEHMKKLLGPKCTAKLAAMIDDMSQMGQKTIDVLLRAHRVPQTDWREVLADLKQLDQHGLSRGLQVLAIRIQDMPSVAEKTQLADAVGDAIADDLRGEEACAAMHSFAMGMGAACRADTGFEAFIDSRE